MSLFVVTTDSREDLPCLPCDAKLSISPQGTMDNLGMHMRTQKKFWHLPERYYDVLPLANHRMHTQPHCQGLR